MPKTGLEPARREAHAPETCASTNSATWAFTRKTPPLGLFRILSGKRDSDPRPRPWQGRALPTELLPPVPFQRSISLNAVQRYGFFLNLQNFCTFFFIKLHFLLKIGKKNRKTIRFSCFFLPQKANQSIRLR